MKKKKKLTV